MKNPTLIQLSSAGLLAGVLLGFVNAKADTILNFDTSGGGAHNIPIAQSFGDFAVASRFGLEVTGIGTPDIDLSWSAINNPGNGFSPETRWDYYSIDSEDFWRVGQLNQSKVGDYHDLKFTPGNGAKVVIKSFNFHGYYGVLILNNTNIQERFTYDWSVLDGNTQATLASGNYTFLSDETKNHPITVNYTGTNGQSLILRLARVASVLDTSGDPIEVEGDPADIGIDDITFSEETANANPVVTFVSQPDGVSNASPTFSYRAVILDGFATQVATNSIQLKLDGVLLAPSITKTGLVTTVNFSAGGLIRSGSTNTYTLTFSDNGAPASNYTNEATFVVQKYTSYEWRFTSGDLTTDLGNGSMSFVSGPAGTSFDVTDGNTVPHISGNPANYMHVPAFISDSDGYHLVFADSGPNVGTNAYINKYSLLFDILVPSPWPLDYIVPFFNTDPQNFNDADFYLHGDGGIGIGGDGYSNPGVLTPDTWNRVAFVADLEANTLTYYVNGVSVKSRPADGLGGRWSLYSNQDVGPLPLVPANLLLFNEGDGSGTYTHELYVSSVAFTDRVLSAAEAATLGSPKASGVFVPSFSTAPLLSIETAGANVTISWPSNYVGYALERTDEITSSSWKPVAGITNNSVILTPGNTGTFFRLVQ